MATTYYGAMPNKETLRPGDVIQYDNNVTFQHPDIQELFKQNSVIPYYDKSGAATGAQVQTPYIKPTTTFSPTGEQINQPVDLGAYGFTEPSGRYVIDSESNRLRGITPDMEQAAAEKARAQGLIPYFKSANTKGGSKKEPDLMTTFNDLLEAQKGAIEQQRQQNISNINSRSSSAIQGTKDVAGRSSGALQRILGRAGGFTTTAGGEAVASQANTLNQQVQALESERERSIAQANLAASTGNAALLDKAMSNMLAIEQATREKQQQQQKNLMDYLGLVNEEKTLKQGEKTPDIKEYEYAVAQGYTGSWQDYQNSLKGESKLMTLKAGDVVYDPKTGQKVYEVPDTEKGDVQVIGNADMGYFQYDSKTNGWKQIVTPQTKDPADDLLTKDELVAFNMPAGSTWGDVQGMTPKTELTGEGKTRLFVSIADKYQADSIVKTYDSAATTTAIADQIIADPNKATNQLKALYLLVKNLDPDSAVREGELSLANSTQSYWQKFENVLTRVGKGQVISPQAATELATATKELMSAWELSKNAREAKYAAQAKTAGLEKEWNDYVETFTDTVQSANKPKTVEEYYTQYPQYQTQIQDMINDGVADDEIRQTLDYISGFNSVGGDTNKASDKTISKVSTIPDNSKGGQCGRFVNNIAKLGVGDSYQSKLDKMDKNIKTPKPGMVFIMKYKDTGHTGFILDIKDGIATVKDSNYFLDEKVRTHQIPVSKMTGFKQIS